VRVDTSCKCLTDTAGLRLLVANPADWLHNRFAPQLVCRERLHRREHFAVLRTTRSKTSREGHLQVFPFGVENASFTIAHELIREMQSARQLRPSFAAASQAF
jgi:hypothetical protein